MAATGVHQQRRRVQVLFGDHVMVNKVADPELADRFEQAMRRRFPSLNVTNEPAYSRVRTAQAEHPGSTGKWQSGPC